MRLTKAEGLCYALAAWLILAAVPGWRHHQEVADLQDQLITLRAKHANELLQYTDLSMTVTAYTASADECDSTPETTAYGHPSRPGVTAAVSADRAYMTGRWVLVPGLGKYRVEDVPRPGTRNTLDVMVHDKKKARKVGRKRRRVILL